MIAWARKLSRERMSTWGLLCGAIVGGTIVKIGYFAHVRQIFKDDAEKSTQTGMAHLKEARAYAEQQAAEREKQMPQLTPEQEEQMRNYMKMVNEHGINKLSQIQDDKDCVGCPFMSKTPLRPPPVSS